MRVARWLFLLVVVAGCAGGLTGRRRDDGQPALYALLLNGGGSPGSNYLSHLHHIAEMHQLLRARGVPPERISVLASDGEFAAPDVAASRPAGGADAWLLAGTVLERSLRNPTRYVNTRIEGVASRPAHVRELESWFRDAGDELRAGDTLLLFVTDHGQRGATPQDNRITLWMGQTISVRELGALIDRLAPGVRVVTVMSQCYSGGFAELAIAPGANGRRIGDTCGYFSTTADRMAYGCYPESRSGQDVGHAFSFIAGLRRTPALADAHGESLLTDRTPDVPLRSSDLYAERVLQRVAAQRGQTVEDLVASRLPAALQPEREATRLIAQIAGSFAIPVPAERDALAATTERLEGLRGRLEAAAVGWTTAVGELAQANLDGFLKTHPRWGPRLAPAALARIGFNEIAPFQSSFLGELGAFTRSSGERLSLLGFGRHRLTATTAAAGRAETRSAALLRLRSLLGTLVAEHLLQEEGSAEEKSGLAALRACEDLRLPAGPSAAFTPPAPLPPIESDERIANALAPAFLGAVLSEPARPRPPAEGLPAGAAAIAAVDPGSPAEVAGLRPGDILLGAPDRPVLDRGAMKLFLASPSGSAVRELEILRAGQRLTVRATPVAANKPAERPDLPAAARAALDGLTGYRGPLAATIAARRPYLLFFWATWCPACKRSVPELLAMQRARGIPVVAITDESPDLLDSFLARWSGGFPEIVALDAGRRASEIFQVAALPTYILVDENQRVQVQSLGYDPKRGLPVPGWRFLAGDDAGPR